MTRVRYPAEFKAEAVRQVTKRSHSAGEVSNRPVVSNKSPFSKGKRGFVICSKSEAIKIFGGVDGTRTRDPRRDRPVF